MALWTVAIRFTGTIDPEDDLFDVLGHLLDHAALGFFGQRPWPTWGVYMDVEANGAPEAIEVATKLIRAAAAAVGVDAGDVVETEARTVEWQEAGDGF